MTREQWLGLSPENKLREISFRLRELIAIDKKIHPLYNSGNQQGKIPSVRKQLEIDLLNFLEWENRLYEENRRNPQ